MYYKQAPIASLGHSSASASATKRASVSPCSPRDSPQHGQNRGFPPRTERCPRQRGYWQSKQPSSDGVQAAPMGSRDTTRSLGQGVEASLTSGSCETMERLDTGWSSSAAIACVMWVPFSQGETARAWGTIQSSRVLSLLRARQPGAGARTPCVGCFLCLPVSMTG